MAEISGQLLAESGAYWIATHYPQFKEIMYLVHSEIDEGNMRVQRGDIYLLCRKHHIDVSVEKEFKRSNNLWAVISRYMVMINPRLAIALHFAPSKVDEVDLVKIWNDTVKQHKKDFCVTSWKEAKKLVEDGVVR